MRRRLSIRLSQVGLCAVAFAMVALAACGDGGGDEPDTGSTQPQGGTLKLTLGTKNITEAVIIGELYAQALTAKGYQVVLRKNVGPTEVIDKALEDGEIDAYPEYLGVAATVVVGEDVEGKSAEETLRIARDFYAARGQALSNPTPFENVDVIATTFLFAQENQLREVGDLSKLDAFRLGARPEFEARQQGFAGMQQEYALTNGKFVPIAIGARFVALDEGDVDVANVFSTDPQLAGGDYRVLKDTKRVFGYQHVALVMDQKKLDVLGGDRFMRIVNDVNRRLSQDTMIGLNRAVDLDGRDAAAVAAEFLRQAGLLAAGND